MSRVNLWIICNTGPLISSLRPSICAQRHCTLLRINLCNVEIFESFCPHLTWRHKGSTKKAILAVFSLLWPKFVAGARSLLCFGLIAPSSSAMHHQCSAEEEQMVKDCTGDWVESIEDHLTLTKIMLEQCAIYWFASVKVSRMRSITNLSKFPKIFAEKKRPWQGVMTQPSLWSGSQSHIRQPIYLRRSHRFRILTIFTVGECGKPE